MSNNTITENGTSESKLTSVQRVERDLLATLAELGGQLVTEDNLHFEGKQYVFPKTMEGDIPGVINFLKEHLKQQEQETRFSRVFNFRPLDGARALSKALKRVFGTSGHQKAQFSFFGTTPPELRTISVSYTDTEQVPWGEIAVPIFQGTMRTTHVNDATYGPLFRLVIDAPRKYRGHVDGLFKLVEEELRSNSIYKGKAIDGQTEPDFIDLSGVDPDRVIYSADVREQLATNVWTPLRHAEVLRELKVPLKRAVLLEGSYGTGKTLAAFLTAQVAIEEGWTFIYCRPGKDDLDTVVSTARLYQPAVVFFEDVDTIAQDGNADNVTRLLDIFDGITAKGTELMIVMTTNHADRIHKGMMRPGRLDAAIHFGALDRDGVKALIESVIPSGMLDTSVDYDLVYESMIGYTPAFCKESIDRAIRYAVTRMGGRPDVLNTHDFVSAANGLRPQLRLMEEAGEGKITPPLDLRFKELIGEKVVDVLGGAEIVRRGYDETFADIVVGNGSDR